MLGSTLRHRTEAQPSAPRSVRRQQGKLGKSRLSRPEELGGTSKCSTWERPDLQGIANYLRAFREVYQLEYPQVNAVVGIAYKAYPINATDALWAKYELGAQWKINDPLTGNPATRNVFVEPAAGATDVVREASIRALRARGAIFWMCNNALNTVVDELSRATNQQFDAVRAELIAGLLPGVKLIPAHAMLIGLAQQHGCAYQKV